MKYLLAKSFRYFISISQMIYLFEYKMETLTDVSPATDMSYFKTFIHVEEPLVPYNPMKSCGVKIMMDIIYLDFNGKSKTPEEFVVPV